MRDGWNILCSLIKYICKYFEAVVFFENLYSSVSIHHFVPQMAVTDVYNHRFHKVFAPNDRIDSITDRDDIFVYEVPVNVSDNPDTCIIPVYLREKR